MESEKNLSSPRRNSIIAREGWVFILTFLALAIIFSSLGIWFVGAPFFLLAFFAAFFFRNPERVIVEDKDVIVSPADGRIVEVLELSNNKFTGGPAKKVGIFMSVFNVHVNRAPVAGKVKNILYHPGKFLVASKDKASENNERNAVLLDIGRDSIVAVVQIAGFIARRIVCYFSEGDMVNRGERLGLIRFGSRVDLYLPPDVDINVSVGDKVKAGISIIGRLK